MSQKQGMQKIVHCWWKRGSMEGREWARWVVNKRMRRVSQHDVCYDQLRRRLPHEEEKEEEEEEKEEGEETTVHSSRYLRSCYCDGWKVVDPVPVVHPNPTHIWFGPLKFCSSSSVHLKSTIMGHSVSHGFAKTGFWSLCIHGEFKGFCCFFCF